MILEPPCLLPHLNFGSFDKRLFKNRVEFAAEHHVLPNHHAIFVRQLVEVVVQVHASTPYPYYVEVGLCCRRHEPFELSPVLHPVRVIIKRHLIRSFHVNWHFVYLEVEVLAIRHGVFM